MATSVTTLRNRLLSRARIRHLHVFVKIAELQTVKRAAEAVGVTQPSATQGLADLERLLESPLFLRHAQGMALTPAGTALLPLARRMIDLVDQTATFASGLLDGASSVVRVAAISAAMGGELGGVVPAFARRHPSIVLELIEADAVRQATLVANAEVDCAVCRRPAVLPSGWSFHPLWPDRFAIIAGSFHPLATKQRVSRADLLDSTWLVPPTSIAARAVFDRYFHDDLERIKLYNIVAASPLLIWRLLSQEPLLALVPHSVAATLLSTKQLCELSWPEKLPFGEIGVLAPANKRNDALEKLLSFLQSATQSSAAARPAKQSRSQ